MRILLLGSGGREHALAWKIKNSKHTNKLWIAPGSAGMASEGECVSIPLSDQQQLLQFIKTQQIDLVVVGPEAPLVDGFADLAREQGVPVFGPMAAGARLEASKAFTKNFLDQHKIPTASFKNFSDPHLAKEYLKNQTYPCVIKADGLAAGKGVVICQNFQDGVDAIDEILVAKKLGAHQSQVVIESFLIGEEASFMVALDGSHVLALATSQDHKRLLDNDEGPNTGGMGAYSPAPVVTQAVHQRTIQEIIRPTLQGLQKEGIDYRGILYAGLMIDQEKPSLLEYNVRFGDPECQVLLPRMKSDFVELAMACVQGKLDQFQIEWDARVCVTVVLAAEGYPSSPKKGDVIEGIEEAQKLPDILVFHSGTERKNSQWLTAGGRVLAVTALGDTLESAVTKAYEAVGKIHWRGMQYRKDIGKKGMGALPG